MKSNAKMVFEDRTWGCGKGVSAPTRIGRGGDGGWGGSNEIIGHFIVIFFFFNCIMINIFVL